MNYTLITGGSKGIGKELALQFAKHHCNLLLVARSAPELEEQATALEGKYSINVRWLALDLLAPQAVDTLLDFCQAENIQVRILVNNAGFGHWQYFAESNLERQLSMVALNQKVLISLCHRFIPILEGMPEPHILNVSSVAAFQPMAGFAVYAATKAFVYSFSQSLRFELKPKGINVSCLCPGPTETEFFSNASFNHKLDAAQGIKMPSSEVAKQAVDDMLAKKAVSIPGFTNKLGAWFSKHLPAGLTTSLLGTLVKYSKED